MTVKEWIQYLQQFGREREVSLMILDPPPAGCCTR